MRSVNGKRTQWLDKALEDQPSDRRARVLEIILKYGIDPEDEFFIIFVALGQLQALIEESPQSWQTLFSDFESVLETWSNNNIAILAATAENSKEHAEGLTKLKKILSIYGRILEQLKNDTANLSQNYKSLNSPQSDFYKTWDKTLNDTLDKIEKLIESDILERQRELATIRQQRREIFNGRKMGILIPLSIFGFLFLSLCQWKQYQMNQEILQHSQWMWTNQLKQQCLDGKRAVDSLECRSSQ